MWRFQRWNPTLWIFAVNDIFINLNLILNIWRSQCKAHCINFFCSCFRSRSMINICHAAASLKIYRTNRRTAVIMIIFLPFLSNISIKERKIRFIDQSILIREPEISAVAPTVAPTIFHQPCPVGRWTACTVKIFCGISIVPANNCHCMIGAAFCKIAIIRARIIIIIIVCIHIHTDTGSPKLHQCILYLCSVRRCNPICIFQMCGV